MGTEGSREFSFEKGKEKNWDETHRTRSLRSSTNPLIPSPLLFTVLWSVYMTKRKRESLANLQ